MDQKWFKEVTGAEWIEEMHIPPGAAFPVYSPSPEDRDLMEFLLPKYFEYLQKPPKLTLQVNDTLSLHADQPISRGTVIVEYLGVWEPGSKTPSSYRFGPINGLHFRNFAGLAEDGFPNMTPFYLYDVRGLPLRVIFVALEDIGKGDILTFNYGGNHSVKLGEHIEYRLEQMVEFFKENSLSHSLQTIKELHVQKRSLLGFEKSLELENLVAKVQYLYQTPSALLHLLLLGVVEKEEIFAFWKKPDYRYYLLGVPFNPNAREREWIEKIDFCENIMIGLTL